MLPHMPCWGAWKACFLKKGRRQHLPKITLFLIGCLFYFIFFEGCEGIQCLGKPLDGEFRRERKAWNPHDWDQQGQLGEHLWVPEIGLCPLPSSPFLQVSQLEKVLMSPSACHLGTLLWTDSVDIILLPQLSCRIKPYHKCPPTARQTNR